MARPRKPSSMLERSGAFDKDPQRRRVDPSTPGAIGDPPATLADRYHALWYQLIHEAPIGVLTGSDRALLEIGVKLLHADQHAREWCPRRHAALMQFFTKVGMTPADRTRLAIPAKDRPENPFDEFADSIDAARKAKPQ
jgi:hypothetical protein